MSPMLGWIHAFEWPEVRFILNLVTKTMPISSVSFGRINVLETLYRGVIRARSQARVCGL
jgi:hypothetical protein